MIIFNKDKIRKHENKILFINAENDLKVKETKTVFASQILIKLSQHLKSTKMLINTPVLFPLKKLREMISTLTSTPTSKTLKKRKILM